ncbi:MAG: IS21 family transposase [Chloroflexi bacterium]|nr:IS21 family transposase [Chloroflexota bacterium]
MRQVKEILRLKHVSGLSNRQIARSLGICHTTVNELTYRLDAAGLSWPLPTELDEGSLEAMLYPGQPKKDLGSRPTPDMEKIHRELRRKGVTLQLLWIEYKKDNPNGYQYSQFCDLYRRWRGKLDVVMHQVHRAGEKLFVDYAGQTVPIVDRRSGETHEAQIFVAVLGASNYTYVEASSSQDLAAWIGAHCRAFEFLGGVPEIVVPDNTKTAISHACRYDPDVNAAYQEMADFYGVAVIPARPRKPRDKAKVEVGVQVVERWILAALRNRTFFSLSDLNQAISEILVDLNRRLFQKMKASRLSLFETLDKPELRPLPAKRYELAQWKTVRVNIDYHVEYDHCLYSVPYQLVHQKVEVRATFTSIEVLHKGRRVASHVRSSGKVRFVTDPKHLPTAHREYLAWTPSRIIKWAETAGPNTAELVRAILESRPHPEQGYRACLGLIRLAPQYPTERFEAAARRALDCRALSYRSVRSILDKGLDKLPLQAPPERQAVLKHPNIRGPQYYSGKGEGQC